MSQGQPTIVTVIPDNVTPSSYPKSAFKLGSFQLVSGFLAMLFAIMAIIVNAPWGPVGAGIWCGLAFMVAGILGILSSMRNGNTCVIVAFMVLSIIAAVFSGILMAIAIASVMSARQKLNYSNLYNMNNESEIKMGLAANVIQLIISMIEGVLAIVSSTICCKTTCLCCNSQDAPGTVYYYPGQVPGSSAGQQVTVITLPYSPGTVYSVPPGSFVVQQPTENVPSASGITPGPSGGLPPPMYTAAPPPPYSTLERAPKPHTYNHHKIYTGSSSE